MVAYLTPSPYPDDVLPDDEASRRLALGAFLRARRESLDPVRLGVISSGRRRTPGLRRDDVAQMADISVTWYTRLEQGQPIRVSPKVMSGIASALQCSDTETQHLFTLAGLGRMSPRQQYSCQQATFAMQSILDHLDPLPALLQTARFDIVACNRAYDRLLGLSVMSLPPEERNCLLQALTNPVWRARLVDWSQMIPQWAALYRTAMAEHLDEPVWQQQLQRYFDASPEFQQIWQRQEVLGFENRIKRFDLPGIGIVALQQTNWWSAPRNGNRMLVYSPVDAAGELALQQLARPSDD